MAAPVAAASAVRESPVGTATVGIRLATLAAYTVS